MGGIGSGGFRPNSGRPPGARNKKALQLIEQAERDDLQTPISFLLNVMRDSRQALHDRMMAANICMPYMHARLVPQPVAYIDPDRMSDAALLESIRRLEQQVAEAGAEDPPYNPAPGSVIRPGDDRYEPAAERAPPPAPAGSRHLRYDPVAKEMVQAVK